MRVVRLCLNACVCVCKHAHQVGDENKARQVENNLPPGEHIKTPSLGGIEPKAIHCPMKLKVVAIMVVEKCKNGFQSGPMAKDHARDLRWVDLNNSWVRRPCPFLYLLKQEQLQLADDSCEQ